MKFRLPNWPPPIPKEHGAWGILIGSFLSVIAITHTLSISQLLFFTSVVLFYFSRHTFLIIIKTKKESIEKDWFIAFSIVGWLFLIGTLLLSKYYFIVLWSLIFPLFFITEIWLLRQRKKATFFAQLLGTIGLTLIAPLSFLLYNKSLSIEAGYLWLINILFFTSGILFVRFQIAGMKKNFKQSGYGRYKAAMICYHFSLLLILFLIAIIFNYFFGLLIVFIPILIQAIMSIMGKTKFKNLKKVGWLEIAQTIFFVILLSIFI